MGCLCGEEVYDAVLFCVNTIKHVLDIFIFRKAACVSSNIQKICVGVKCRLLMRLFCSYNRRYRFFFGKYIYAISGDLKENMWILFIIMFIYKNLRFARRWRHENVLTVLLCELVCDYFGRASFCAMILFTS